MAAYSADAQTFDPVLWESMIVQYAKAYRVQFNDDRPLVHLGKAVSDASDAQLSGGSGDVAWAIRFRYLRNLRLIEDRRNYMPQVVELQKKVASPDAAEELERFRADHMGAL